MKHELLELIKHFDVISFDIFDTLLVRNVLKPKDIWRILEQEEKARGFFAARDVADRATYAAATKRGGEHTMDEVYSLMGGRWTEYRKKELDAEKKALFPNPEIVELWNEAGRLGKKRILVSDMYLSRSEIEMLLHSKGVNDWDALFVSSEYQCRKATGKLFEIMLGKLSVTSDHVMHIGDSPQGDFAAPQRLGITAFCYPKIAERFFDECPLAKEFLSYRPSFEKQRLVGALAYGWHVFKAEYANMSFWHKIGFLYGGILGYAFVHWIGKTAKGRGINHLMFVGRDGYVWEKIAREILHDIKSDYFYAPRTMSVRVQGVFGIDPSAIKDRQMYIDECLGQNDKQTAEDDYKAYLSRFDVEPKKTALVDGMSSAFSAQRLVEYVKGYEIFTFYLFAYAKPNPGIGFFESRMSSVSFQNFSEFLFGSPEPPVEYVAEGGAVYSERFSSFEKIKMSASEQIAEAAVFCAKELHRADILVSPQDWQDYFDAGMRTLTTDDRWQLAIARNSTDVAHRHYAPITVLPMSRSYTRLSLLNFPILKYRLAWRDGTCCCTWLLFGLIPIRRKKTKVYWLAKVSRD